MLRRRRFKKFENRSMQVYAVGGGKGGIGKSFISSNLALFFARKGYRTLVVDLDFGGANAHTYLETPKVDKNLFDFAYGRVKELRKVIVETKYKGLHLLPCSSGWSSANEISNQRLQHLFEAVRELPYHKVIYDLGAGTSYETLEAFLQADKKILVSTPEPISIENSYQFLKKTFYKSIKNTAAQLSFREKLNIILKDKKNLGLKTPADLMDYIVKYYPNIGRKMQHQLSLIQPHIVINQCRSVRDQQIGKSMAQISRRFFGVPVHVLPNLSYENKVWQSVRAMKPLAVSFPESHTLSEIRQMVSQLEGIDKSNYEAYSKVS